MKRMQTRMKGRMIRKVGKWEQWQDEKLECKQIVQTNLETRRLLRLPRECSTLEIFLTSSHCPYAYSHSRYQLHIEVQCTPTIISSQFQNSFAFVFCSTRNEKSVYTISVWFAAIDFTYPRTVDRLKRLLTRDEEKLRAIIYHRSQVRGA